MIKIPCQPLAMMGMVNQESQSCCFLVKSTRLSTKKHTQKKPEDSVPLKCPISYVPISEEPMGPDSHSGLDVREMVEKLTAMQDMYSRDVRKVHSHGRAMQEGCPRDASKAQGCARDV